MKKKKLKDVAFEIANSSEIANAETFRDELNKKKVYEYFGTQEELYPLKDKIEGFEEYFGVLEKDILGKDHAHCIFASEKVEKKNLEQRFLLIKRIDS